MPIKFACPKCNKVMSVPDNLAGKSGKCKCGHKIQIPAAKVASPAATSNSAQPAPESSALAGKFDELTESDFGRTSPFDAVYNPKKSNNDLQTLKRFNAKEEEEQIKKATAAGGMLKLVAVIEIVLGIAAIVFAVMYAASPDNIDKLSDHIPELTLSKALGITFLSISAVVCLGGAIGVFMKKGWGWVLTGTTMVYLGIARLISTGLILKDGFDQTKFFGAMIPLFVVFALSLIVFKEEARLSCGLKKAVPTIIAGVLGLAAAGTVFGIILSSGTGTPTPV